MYPDRENDTHEDQQGRIATVRPTREHKAEQGYAQHDEADDDETARAHVMKRGCRRKPNGVTYIEQPVAHAAQHLCAR